MLGTVKAMAKLAADQRGEDQRVSGSLVLHSARADGNSDGHNQKNARLKYTMECKSTSPDLHKKGRPRTWPQLCTQP